MGIVKTGRKSVAVRRKHVPGRILLIVTLLLSLFVLVGSMLSMAFPLPAHPSRILDGTWAGRINDEFEAALPFTREISDLRAWLSYLFFNEGLEGVQVGLEGWLFTDEEWLISPAGKDELLEAIGEVHAELKSRGIELVILPIPAKSMVYQEFVSASLPPELKSGYERFVQGLDSRDIEYADFLTSLSESPDEASMFLRTDTHWSPDGAQLAAATLSRLVRESPALSQALAGAPRAEYTNTRGPVLEYEGDLLAFLPARAPSIPGLTRKLPPADSIHQWETVTLAEPQFGLFDTPSVPIALVGTSYSASERWNFVGFLQEVLSFDLVSFALEGLGPLVPIRRALDSGQLEEFGVRLVIWEIPLRYIGDPGSDW